MKIRKSNFELLRIISMLFIIAYHTFAFVDIDNFNLCEKIVFNYVRWYGLLGVDLFILITAYFTLEKPNIKSEKLFSLLLQAGTYCIAFVIVFIAYSICTHSPWREELLTSEIDAAMSPLWSSRYWFISAYIFLYLLIPLLNHFLHGWNKKLYKRIIKVSTVVIFLFMTLPEDADNKTVILNVIWIVYIYLIMGYLKLHKPNNIFDRHGLKIFFSVWTIFCLCRVWLVDYEEIHPHIYTLLRHTFADAMRYSFPALIMALSLFYVFKRIDFSSKIVNYIAGCTFGIYLFHENKVFHLCEFAYLKLYKPFMHYTNAHVFVYMLFILILLFVGGILAEIFRRAVIVPLVEKPLTKILKPYFEKLDYYLNLRFLEKD